MCISCEVSGRAEPFELGTKTHKMSGRRLNDVHVRQLEPALYTVQNIEDRQRPCDNPPVGCDPNETE
jgi:hypothetical protein